jgi:hypothetical protein
MMVMVRVLSPMRRYQSTRAIITSSTTISPTVTTDTWWTPSYYTPTGILEHGILLSSQVVGIPASIAISGLILSSLPYTFKKWNHQSQLLLDYQGAYRRVQHGRKLLQSGDSPSSTYTIMMEQERDMKVLSHLEWEKMSRWSGVFGACRNLSVIFGVLATQHLCSHLSSSHLMGLMGLNTGEYFYGDWVTLVDPTRLSLWVPWIIMYYYSPPMSPLLTNMLVSPRQQVLTKMTLIGVGGMMSYYPTYIGSAVFLGAFMLGDCIWKVIYDRMLYPLNGKASEHHSNITTTNSNQNHKVVLDEPYELVSKRVWELFRQAPKEYGRVKGY